MSVRILLVDDAVGSADGTAVEAIGALSTDHPGAVVEPAPWPWP